MKLAISDDALKDLYNDLTERITQAGHSQTKSRKQHKTDDAWWSGYAEALCWVRDELLELEKPEGDP